ncbi:MAG: transglutaminase domain-containing protein, partial [Gemmatimonadetes bacterium]|nr:transglutaminase domain-containing protein [Gemmatimonadota bacterium]
LLAPGTHFYLVRLREQVIGFAQASLDTIDDGFRFSDQLQLRVPALGRVHETAARTQLELDQALGLRRFEFELNSEAGEFGVRGQVRDSVLELVLASGGEERQERIPLTPDLLLGATLPMRLAAAGALEVGQEHSWNVFDPGTLASRRVSARVTGRDTMIVSDSARQAPDGRWVVTVWDTVPVWRLEQSFGGVRVVSYVDEDGQMVREESPLGYVIERMTYELAREAWDQARRAPAEAEGYGSIIEGTALASNVDLSDLAQREQLVVRLRGVDLTGFDLEGGRQSLRGDTLVVTREVPSPAGYRLPYAGGGAPALELASEPLIQSGDTRIIAAARAAAGGTTDPLVAAERLNAWVYRTLKKDIALTVPSALQVLEARAGDCNEHTVLYVALARALGLPARTAVGLVHVRGRFYYHAWPEVWLNSTWVAVDPTLGQFPADASHLRFLNGGLARQVELIRLIGRLQLTVQCSGRRA